jgi:hypothetical protein
LIANVVEQYGAMPVTPAVPHIDDTATILHFFSSIWGRNASSTSINTEGKITPEADIGRHLKILH